MSSAAIALCGVFGGCQANIFLLELIIASSPNTYYALTFAQYVAVVVLALPLVTTIRRPSSVDRSITSWFPLHLRPSRLLLSHKFILAFWAWFMTVSNNLVFGFHVSVPIYATFRSSSLLLNMLAGYFFLGKRYTLWQVLCAGIICGGIIVLTVEKSRKQAPSSFAAAELSANEQFWQACGLAIITATTALGTGLGVFQDYMYRTARQLPDERDTDVAPSPVWAEALFFSHILALPLFFLQPWRLWEEMNSIAPSATVYFILNAVTQYVCVAGVYILSEKTSSFTLILTLTLRKLGSFALSVLYFGHYWQFTSVEWLSMVLAIMAGALYPMLPKPAPVTVTSTKKSN